MGAIVGAATPNTSVTELLPELAIHRFPEISMETLLGALSRPPVKAVAETGVPLELNTEIELFEFVIQICPRPSIARLVGALNPPPV
jgi:hypothetical protein